MQDESYSHLSSGQNLIQITYLKIVLFMFSYDCFNSHFSERPFFMFVQGESWHHITTNTQFLSISVGCNYNIWGIGVDGAAYLRVGYAGSDDAGTPTDP